MIPEESILSDKKVFELTMLRKEVSDLRIFNQIQVLLLKFKKEDNLRNAREIQNTLEQINTMLLEFEDRYNQFYRTFNY